MCEWLESAEWCDVQLLCRGRVFSAHRAVLASVSAFLRNILLSCQDENSPAFIILPDFDLDAMFSVLYYIYNGEVAIPHSRLESFLDIIVTLKIFIDKAFLGRIQESVRGFDKDIETLKSCNNYLMEGLSYPKAVFKLTSNYTETVYVSLKKGLHYPILMQEAPDGGDKRELCSHLGPYLENIQSLHGARQKRSLRDSFIEPYPRNGNVNGRPGGVPAILNGHYLDVASALLPNANGNDARPFDALSLRSHNPAAGLTSETLSLIHCINRHSTTQRFPYQTIQNVITAQSIVNNCSTKSPIETLVPDELEEQRLARKKMSALLDLTVTKSMANPVSSLAYQNHAKPKRQLPNLSKIVQFEGSNKNESNISVKKGISNQVMQSPWSPRMPLSYKPFRRKVQKKKSEAIAIAVVNDNNNNIEEPSQEHQIKELALTEIPLEANQSNPDSINEDANSLEDTKCNISGQAFPDQDSLTTHCKSHTAARFTCPECSKTFSQLRNFKYHMSVHRGTREFAATCSVCGKYFNDRGYLSSHMKIHRNRKEYKCHICPKSFNQRVAYNMHVRIHTGVKPHVCEQCGKAFSRKMLLKQHQRTHSGERPYACAHCDKRFADRSNMTLHLRLHTGVKPFSCSLCPKSFTKKHHLKSHLNFHTGAKPYSCPRCHLAFTQSSNMRTHFKKCKINLLASAEGESPGTGVDWDRECCPAISPHEEQ